MKIREKLRKNYVICTKMITNVSEIMKNVTKVLKIH